MFNIYEVTISGSIGYMPITPTTHKFKDLKEAKNFIQEDIQSLKDEFSSLPDEAFQLSHPSEDEIQVTWDNNNYLLYSINHFKKSITHGIFRLFKRG